MPDPRPSNWRTVPAFNYEHPTLGDCVACAVKEFSQRMTTNFLILRHNTLPFYLIMPWSQFRSAPVDHPVNKSTILFKGTILELRQIAFSFPPDLLNSFPEHPGNVENPEEKGDS
jgi:hypothetical protein